MTIYLIGYMGAGKTTLGADLAALMQVEFIDLDDFIEERCGMTVSEIFATLGEARFREMEVEALRTLAGSDAVIATGGGTPCRRECMELMNVTGLTVWLNPPLEVLCERLLLPEQRSKRPLLASLDDDALCEFVALGAADRAPHYAAAHVHYDSTNLDPTALLYALSARGLEVRG